MPARDKLHGVKHIYLPDYTKPIESLAASVGFVVATSDDADVDTFPLNKHVLVVGTSTFSKAGTGILAKALKDCYKQQPSVLIVVRIASDADENQQVANIVGSIDNETNSFTGMQMALSAESKTGFIPRLFIAPEFSHIETVGKALENIAKKLKGIAIIEGQRDGLSAGIQDKERYDEVIFVDNGVASFDADLAADVERGGSATILGHIVRNDKERGYHTSPSNQLIYEIHGPVKEVDYVRGSETCMADVLSKNDICTVINKDGGSYFWGNRLSNGVLIPHQRLRYLIGDSIVVAHEEYLDRNLTTDYYRFVRDRVNAYIRTQVLKGILSGGECWVDVDLNKALINENEAWWDYKLGFYNVAETMVFRQHVTNEYNNEIIDRIAA
ncbi:MAG: phage tail sheath C-terminal domain-containing protein [Pseudomonadota bacterium]